MDTFWQTETVSPQLGVSGLLFLCAPSGQRGVFASFPSCFFGAIGTSCSPCLGAFPSISCSLQVLVPLLSQGLKQAPWEDLLRRVPEKVCSEPCSPSLCHLLQFQSFVPKHGHPLLCCTLPHRLASLISFLLPLFSGWPHAYTSSCRHPHETRLCCEYCCCPDREGSPSLCAKFECLSSSCLLAVWCPWQTFPFFGVVPAIVNESGEELEGEAEGYLVKRG